jgi:hypothetical protein
VVLSTTAAWSVGQWTRCLATHARWKHNIGAEEYGARRGSLRAPSCTDARHPGRGMKIFALGVAKSVGCPHFASRGP